MEVGLPSPFFLFLSGLNADNCGILGDSGALRWKESQALNDCMKETLSLTSLTSLTRIVSLSPYMFRSICYRTLDYPS